MSKFNFLPYIRSTFVTSCYEGEGNNPGNNLPQTGAGQNDSPTNPQPINIEELKKNPEFQKFLNGINADEKRKNKLLADQLRELQQNVQLTQEQKDQLATQIQQLEESYQTKEELQKKELAKIQTEAQKKLDAATKERDTYKGLFERKLVSVDIAQAAQKYEAFKAEQIEAILSPITVVEEALDAETGKPNGERVARVNFIGRDKDGKDIKLKVSIDEAVKLMSEMTDKYGNLFKNKSVDGVGENTVNGGNGSRIPNIDEMDHASYMKNRDKILAQMKAGR